jgi:sigma-B regulation protein RsbU (phosphoserine phosphatase)
LTAALAAPGGLASVGPALRKAGGALATEMFLTHFFAWFDGDIMNYVNAGHADAICFRPADDGEPLLLATTEPLVNPEFMDLELPARSLEFPPQSRLLLLTDGISEARSPDGEMFTRDRAVAAAGKQPGTLAEAVLEALTRFRAGRPQEDDYTLLSVIRS